MSEKPQATRVRVLFVEDSDDDVQLELHELREAGFAPDYAVAEDEDELRAALQRERWELVIADHRLPTFSGLAALRVVKASDPELPFILVSGTVGEDVAVAAMRAGANDYVLKDNLTRLGVAVERELREAAGRRERRRIEDEQRFSAEVNRFLADAGSVLGRTLDVESTVREATRLAVPRLADHAVGFVVAEGRLRAVEHARAIEAGGEDLARALGDAPLVASTLAGGASLHVPEIDDDARARLAGKKGDADALRRLDLRSALIVPLRGRSEPLGALLLASSSEHRRYAARELAAIEDFAVRVGLAVENARLYAQAQEAIRVRDEFLALLGHELRNPLAPILTGLELMKLRGQVGREHQVLERQARHMVRLVDDLLDISRITRGKVELQRAQIELGVVIAAAIETASPLIAQRQHRLAVSVPTSGLPVFADEQRLVQVFSNLLTNAARYTEPGGEIRVRASRRGAQIVASVADTGVGIPPELLPKLFDAFVQGQRTIERREGGLGLGLALARNLVELHGGTIEARSAGLGRGSEFTVRLPARDAPPTSVEAPPPSRPSKPVGQTRVLVVDDNHDAAEMLVEGLRLEGFDVHVAHHPSDALAQIDALRPDAVVLDIGLPEMDGYQLAARLRERLGPALRLVALSGYGQESDKAKSRAAGFDAHFVKPADLARLAEALAGDAPT